MSRVQFGKYVRKLRLKTKLSQLEVAHKLTFKSGQLVSNWERGQCYPPIENFRALAELYRVDLKVLFAHYQKAYMTETWNRVSGSKPLKRTG